MDENDNRLWILISDIRAAYEKVSPTPGDRLTQIGREATGDVSLLIGRLTTLATEVDYNQYDYS
jgi:hypothetical protein